MTVWRLNKLKGALWSVKQDEGTNIYDWETQITQLLDENQLERARQARVVAAVAYQTCHACIINPNPSLHDDG
jgi:hypothetical protein